MKPIIGITAFAEDDLSSRLNVAYSESIIEAGGIPFIIPLGVEEDAAQILSLTDGLLLSGGHDVHPFEFGAEPLPRLGKIHPERDKVELVPYLMQPLQGKCRYSVFAVVFKCSMLH